MNNLKIGTRLGAGFLVVLLFLFAISALAGWGLDQASSVMRDMMDQPLAKERLVSDWYRAIHTSVRRTTAVVKSADPALAAYFAPENADSSKRASELQQAVSERLSTEPERAAFARVVDVRQKYITARDQVTALKAQDPTQAAEVFERAFVPAGQAYLAGLQALLDTQRAQIDALAVQAGADAAAARLRILVLGALAVLAGGALAWSITRSVTLPLRSAVEDARRVAAGNLEPMHAIQRADETGQLLRALDEMRLALAGMINQIRQSTDAILIASDEIAAGNLDLSQRTEHAAGNLQRAAAAMDELTTTVGHGTEAATQADKWATAAAEVAQRGGEMVARVVSTMDEINVSSKRVVDIIGVIDGIAFQTNILALNAAVEAARAGEQGRGFAVVAAEVRVLAQRSAQAAREIKSLIGASVERVDEGSRLVGDTGATMRELVQSVQRVSGIVAQITVASTEQRAGIGEVNTSVAELEQLTQQNSALVEQSTAAAQSLHEQVSRLAGSMARFKTDSQVAV